MSALSIVAISCLAASGSALAAQFKAEVAPVNYIGSVPIATPLVFSTSAGTATCGVTQFSGTNNAANTTAEMPLYFGAGNCTNFGEKNTSIVPNGCSFKFTIGKKISEGTVQVVCPKLESIEIRKTECLVAIPTQEPMGNVSFANSMANGKRIFEPTFSINTGLEYSATGAKCGTAEGFYTNGGISGTARIAGEDPSKKPPVLQGVWVE